MTVGDKLRELRLKRGLTQQQLSEQILIDRSSICKYETGFSEPTLDSLRKISRYFDVDYNYLLGEKE